MKNLLIEPSIWYHQRNHSFNSQGTLFEKQNIHLGSSECFHISPCKPIFNQSTITRVNYTSWENFPGFSRERLSCFSSLPHTILYIKLIIVSWRNQASRLRYFKLPIMQKNNNDDYPTRIELGIAAAVKN